MLSLIVNRRQFAQEIVFHVFVVPSISACIFHIWQWHANVYFSVDCIVGHLGVNRSLRSEEICVHGFEVLCLISPLQ